MAEGPGTQKTGEADAETLLAVLAATDRSDARWPFRTVAGVQGLVRAARVAEAVVLARGALTLGLPAAAAAELRLALSSIAFMDADPTEAVAEAQAVLDEAGLEDELYAAAELARLMAVMAGRLSDSRRPAMAILAGSPRAGGHASMAGALTAMGSIAWTEGRIEEGIGFLRAAVDRADRESLANREVHPRQTLAVFLETTGDFDEAEALLQRDGSDNVRTGDPAWGAAVAVRWSCLYLAWGRLSDAAVEAERGLVIADEVGARLFVPLALSTLAATCLLSGDLAATSRHLDRCSAEPEVSRAGYVGSFCQWISARMAKVTHGPDEAVELVADVYEDPAANHRLLLEIPGAAPWLVATALDAGHRDRAQAVATAVDGLAAGNPDFGFLAASTAHCRGLLDGDHVAVDRAASQYVHPWARARALEDSGDIVADGIREPARVRFERSLEAYLGMGARFDAERVQARLADFRTAHRRARTERPVQGWAALSGTECHVAELVAEGLTNAEVGAHLFLSRHTIDFHLRQVFRKLDVRSRVELTRLVVEHERHLG